MHNKQEFIEVLSRFVGHRNKKLDALGTSTQEREAALALCYYDAEYGSCRLGDLSYIDKLNKIYAIDYGRANAWKLPGYWAFGGGLEYRYIMKNERKAKSDLAALCANASYHYPGAWRLGDGNNRHELCRELSFSLYNILALENITKLSAAQLEKKQRDVTDLLSICEDWITGRATYMRPFMCGLTARALIRHYNQSADSAMQASILTTLVQLGRVMIEKCWSVSANSFNYTDRDLGVPEDLRPAFDLNMLIAPMFAFLISKQYDSQFRKVAEALFETGFPVYENGVYKSGAYLGTDSPSNPLGKQINQQTLWGMDYFEYMELAEPELPDFPPDALEPLATIDIYGETINSAKIDVLDENGRKGYRITIA